MNLRLFCRVIGRHKRLVAVGALVTLVLAVFAYGTPGPHGITPRGAETWNSNAELLVTQTSFPYGRAGDNYAVPTKGLPPVAVGDQNYLAGLSPIYAAWANGNSIQAVVRSMTRVVGTVQAWNAVSPATGNPAPFIFISSSAATPLGARNLTAATISVLTSYISKQETSAGIPESQRVNLQVLRSGSPPVLAAGHKPTLSILIFVAGIGGIIALAFIRENVERQARAEEDQSAKLAGHHVGVDQRLATMPASASRPHASGSSDVRSRLVVTSHGDVQGFQARKQ